MIVLITNLEGGVTIHFRDPRGTFDCDWSLTAMFLKILNVGLQSQKKKEVRKEFCRHFVDHWCK